MPSIIIKTTDGNGRQSTGTKREYVKVKFSDRIEHLMAYKAQHGHVNVREREDSGLYEFWRSMRKARRGKGGAKVTVARLTALNALGFDWKLPPGVVGQVSGGVEDGYERGGGLTEEQIKKWSQLTEAQTRGGYLPDDPTQTHTLLLLGEDGTNVGNHDSGGKGGTDPGDGGEEGTTNDGRKRGKPKVDFEDRIEQLKIFKAHFGHINVREKVDKSLYEYGRNMRRGRRGKGSAKITEERIAALDAIGFDWKLPKNTGLSSDDRFTPTVV